MQRSQFCVLANHVGFACLALLITLAMSVITARTAMGQAQTPLSLEQVRSLISVGAPDATVAHEIQVRGLAFTPDRPLLLQLEKQRAGDKTLAALQDLIPMLDEAKKQIPGVLQAIYSALDQGNPSAVRTSMSSEVADNSAKLDAICKPFSYRAHYIEAIIERPGRHYEVRTRVLFNPLEERAYVLWFGLSGGTFQLQNITDPPDDWFQPHLKSAEELVRKFIYAVNAGRSDIEQQLVSTDLAGRLNSSKTLAAIRSSQISQVSTQQLGIQYYKGLKIRNEVWVHESGKFCCSTYVFLLEPTRDDLKIVAWASGRAMDGYENEDAHLEYTTLKRFGISAPPASTETRIENAQPSTAPGAERYINQENPVEYLYLASDNKFIWKVGGRDFAGTYELNNEILTLRFPPVGATARGKLINGQFNCCLSNGLDPTTTALIDNESKNWVREGNTQSAAPAQQIGVLRFHVRHRHKPGFITTPQAAGITFCSGTLTIDKSSVQYYCTQPDIGKNRCERVTITDIKEVKYQENGLKIVARGASWDFFFDNQSQLVAAHDGILAAASLAAK